MVVRRLGRRGGSTLGCLVSLALFIAALVYGVRIGEAYWRYYQLLDEIRTQARLAPSLSDDVIRRRLVARAEDLKLPREARRFRIKRTPTVPGTITIETQYNEVIQLPVRSRVVTFKPRAVEPL